MADVHTRSVGPKRPPMPGVVAGKLAPDRLPRGSVARPALVARLRSGRGHGLTLLSAPAGYGKTTLLTEWVATDAAVSFAWISLDAGDREPARLWAHLIASLAQLYPGGIGQAALELARTNPGDLTLDSVPSLVQELAESAHEVVVILDDYHRAESREVNDLVETLVRYSPANVQLVIATRYDPALGVPRLRASDNLVEIRAETLRFDERELSEFLEGVGITGLSTEDLQLLGDRTGGWPAPIRLASILLADQDSHDFIESFSGGHRQIVDYLTDDVLDLLEPDTREFLLRSSILDRLNGGLCDEILGTENSAQILAELERANLFVSVDESGLWYRQHQLFAEALRMELQRTRSAHVPALHAKAAAWLEREGDLETATGHAIASRNVELAARLIAGQVQLLASTGRSATTRRWLTELSWPEARRNAELAFVRAVVASLENRIDEAEEWLDIALTGPPDRQDAAGLRLDFRVDFLRGVVGVNDVGRAAAASTRAVATAPSVGWAGIARSSLGQSQYLQGHTDEAVGTLRMAVTQIPDSHPIMLAFAVANLALAENSQGANPRTDSLVQTMIERLQSIGASNSPAAALLHLAQGQQAAGQGDVRAAVQSYEVAIDTLNPMARSAWLVNAHLLLADALLLLGDGRRAAASLEEADSILRRLPDPGALPERAGLLRARMSVPAHRTTEFGEELSDRETAVLQLVAAGLSQRQIADQLFISHNTVKSHLRTSYRKLGVSSRDAAVIRLSELEQEGTVPSQRPHSPG